MKLRGNHVEEALKPGALLPPELESACITVDTSFMNIIIKDLETFELLNDNELFRSLLNITDTISTQYLIQAHLDENDNPAYQDYIWTINQNFYN